MGFNVIVVPEAASLIFSSGALLDLENYTCTQAVEFQKNLMEIQLALENRFSKLLRIRKLKNQKTAVIYDRGLLDGSAYVDREQWEVIMDENGTTEHDILKRYDLVIHMVTAADGAEKYYQTENNEARSESTKFAISLDRNLQKAYCSHPYHYVVGNYGVSSFSEKIQMVEDFILQKLQLAPVTSYHRKYLIRDPRGELFRYLGQHHTASNFKVVDTFISFSPDGRKVGYLRRRVSAP